MRFRPATAPHGMPSLLVTESQGWPVASRTTAVIVQYGMARSHCASDVPHHVYIHPL